MTSPIIEVQMLIRRPAAEVFNAFIDPAVTTNFWFSKADGKLEKGKTVNWTWEMFGFSTPVLVKDIIENRLIVIDWLPDPLHVEFHFEPRGHDATYLRIHSWGYHQTGDELIKTIIDNTGGFTTVVDGAKAWLEHGIRLGLVEDKFPDLVKH